MPADILTDPAAMAALHEKYRDPNDEPDLLVWDALANRALRRLAKSMPALVRDHDGKQYVAYHDRVDVIAAGTQPPPVADLPLAERWVATGGIDAAEAAHAAKEAAHDDQFNADIPRLLAEHEDEVVIVYMEKDGTNRYAFVASEDEATASLDDGGFTLTIVPLDPMMLRLHGYEMQ